MDEDRYLTLREHKEYQLRTESEHGAITERLSNLEEDVRQMRNIVSDIKTINTNIENILHEQQIQSDRLRSIEEHSLNVRLEHAEDIETALEKRVTELEKKPAKRWESMVGTAIGCIVTAVVTLLLSGRLA